MTEHAGKGLLLLSGGFDSPVAGHLMMKQNVEIAAIHFSLEPVTDDTAERKCMKLAEVLGLGPVYVARVGEVFAEIASKCSHRYYFVLSKRFMIRVAERVAKRGGYGFLVTGENVGQVSSQTLQNLTIIDSASSMPILRPLLGYDKSQVISLSKRLGTYEISKGPEICDALGPSRPSTAATLQVIVEEEAKYDWERSARAVVDSLKTTTFDAEEKQMDRTEAQE